MLGYKILTAPLNFGVKIAIKAIYNPFTLTAGLIAAGFFGPKYVSQAIDYIVDNIPSQLTRDKILASENSARSANNSSTQRETIDDNIRRILSQLSDCTQFEVIALRSPIVEGRYMIAPPGQVTTKKQTGPKDLSRMIRAYTRDNVDADTFRSPNFSYILLGGSGKGGSAVIEEIFATYVGGNIMLINYRTKENGVFDSNISTLSFAYMDKTGSKIKIPLDPNGGGSDDSFFVLNSENAEILPLSDDYVVLLWPYNDMAPNCKVKSNENVTFSDKAQGKKTLATLVNEQNHPKPWNISKRNGGFRK